MLHRTSEDQFWPDRRWWLCLGVLVLIAIVLRYVGIYHGLPLARSDEGVYAVAARWIIDRGTARAIQMQGYPPGIISLFYVIEKFLEPANAPAVLAVGPVRLLAAASGTISVVVAALIGYRLSTPLSGLFSGGLVAVSGLLVTQIHGLAKPDSFLILFTLLALWLMLTGTMFDRGRMIIYAPISLCAAILFKYQAGALAPLFLVFPLLRLKDAGPDKRRAILTNLFDTCVIFGLVLFWLVFLFPALEGSQAPGNFPNPSRVGVPSLMMLSAQLKSLTMYISPPALHYLALGGLLFLAASEFRKHIWLSGINAIAFSVVAYFSLVSIFLVPGVRQFAGAAVLLMILEGIGLGLLALAVEKGITLLGNRLPSLQAINKGLAAIGLVTVVALALTLTNAPQRIKRMRIQTLPNIRVVMMTWGDQSLADGTFISPIGNSLFDYQWSAYEGQTKLTLGANKDVLEKSIEEWRNEGISYVIEPYTQYQKMKTTEVGKSYLSQMVLLKTFPRDQRFAGTPLAVFSLEPIQTRLEATLGTVHFVGYSLSATRVKPKEVIDVRLYWQASKPTDIPYNIFVHLYPVDRDEIAAQSDGAPLPSGRRPTTSWDDPDEILMSRLFSLPVGQDVLPGRYRLVTGFYNPETGQRLIGPNGEQYVDLTMVDIVP